MDARNTYRRLRGLVTLGLLDHRRVLHGEPGAYWATRRGLATIGVALPVAGVDIRTYDHDRRAADVAIDLEAEFGAVRVATERELRSRDTRATVPAYGVRRGGSSGLHFPDLAVDDVDGGRALAVEVELTAKGRSRLDSIVEAYVRARHIAAVRYYVAPAARAGVERAVSRAAAGALFDLRAVDAKAT